MDDRATSIELKKLGTTQENEDKNTSSDVSMIGIDEVISIHTRSEIKYL